MKTKSYFHVVCLVSIPPTSTSFMAILFLALLAFNSACSKRASFNGTPAQLEVSTNKLEFSSLQAGEVERRTFQITNKGDTTASLKNWAQLENPFKILKPTEVASGVPLCGGDLAAHSSCHVVVEFRPESIGSFTQEFSAKFKSSLATETALSLNVKGQGIPAPAAVLTFDSGDLWDFGNQFVGSSQSKVISIHNTGTASAQILTTSFLNNPFSYLGGNFPGTGGTCSNTLTAGQSCTFAVVFNPSITGNFASQFLVQYHDSRQLQISSFDILGQGQNTLEATLGITEGSLLHFGYLDVGQTRVLSVTLNNSGGTDATSISASSLSGAFQFVGGNYPGTGGTCSATLAAGDSCVLRLVFSPTVSGFVSDSLTLNYTHTFGFRSLQLGLDGTGSSLLEAQLDFSLGSLFNFGSVDVNTIQNTTLTVTNTGDIEASFITPSPLSGSLSFLGNSFPGTGGTCGSTLAAGQSCIVLVSFAPLIGGLVSKTLSMQYFNGTQAATTSIVFTGTAIPKGILDTSFGTNGLTQLQIDVLQSVKSLEIQSDQKIVLASEISNGTHSDFALIRLNTNGSLDTTFGSSGLTRSDLGSASDDKLNSSTQQSDGKILLSGQSNNGIALARYNANGTLDTSFNSNGLISGVNGLLISLTNSSEAGYCAAVSSAGHITLVGELASGNNNSFAAQFTSGGAARLLTFGLLGYRTYDFGSGGDDGLKTSRSDSADRIVVSGYRMASGTKRALIARTHLAGNLDSSFGSNGVATADLSGTGHNNELFDFAFQSDGKIVAVGITNNASNNQDVVAIRLNSNGSFDSNFGSGGIVRLDLGSNVDSATSVAIDANGKILIAGNTQHNGNLAPAVIRLNSNGARDISFGNNGVFLQPFSGKDAYIYNVKIQSDGKIITAGRVEFEALVMRHLP
ncbi:choice-of-anchor D domain-containing protein [Pseudobdellovibrio exovorus]|uniref:HYDIN/VesB/CFA65-like Ig-like domain-containing protein n=1 Tax=Pseudobdellovibrio exovorus JSS TaxID=1184267 RepID=M4VBQ5_9BACT|nr:choice-of-anchor D domain-containing protein [Pseudobdellovibrio exovorus]AGH96658.1 hypothetical protein A11Q_2442 [Pseudobdellovibrio exovorus JSS]